VAAVKNENAIKALRIKWTQRAMAPSIIDSFKNTYRDLCAMDISRLDEVYSQQVVFRDPVHEIRGLALMQDYLAATMLNVSECRFEFLDQLHNEQTAYLKWNMHFRHPKLSAGKLLTVRGISQIQYDQRIFYHEDSFDMGQMVYEHIPVMGSLTRWLKTRMAA
jgi:hypothetical protein